MFIIRDWFFRKLFLLLVLGLLIVCFGEAAVQEQEVQEQMVDEIGEIEASALDKHREKEAKALGLSPTAH